MTIYIGADHRGFRLKESLKEFLKVGGYEVKDLGSDHYDKSDDYVDFAKKVSKEVESGEKDDRGILVCGSGVGSDIVANRFPGVRSSLSFSSEHAMAARNDVDANVLSLPADYITQEMAKKILDVWLKTPFSGEETHIRRLKKIEELK
jgi:RpiB/LacA/LacB family sugar-phosphate isomerase